MQFARIVKVIPSILIVVRGDGGIRHWNDAARDAFGLAAEDTVGRTLEELSLKWPVHRLMSHLKECLESRTPLRIDDFYFERPTGEPGCLGLTLKPYLDVDGTIAVLVLGADVTERKLLEAQLTQAQKLESIGQLAAGIAHEINTPTQYVGDNIRFCSRVVESFKPVMEALRALRYGEVADYEAWVADLKEKIEPLNLNMLAIEFPSALAESGEGIKRVGDIVRAMKEFSHPGSEDKSLIDINHAIKSTLTVARNEWKYVAEAVLELDPTMPGVPCVPGEFNQVILNLVVNAAHAVADVVVDSGKMGQIRIETRRNGPWAEIRVSDTGCGIPEGNLGRIFDPFFTTKEVGRGTGQGLAMVHSAIVKRHRGSISVKSHLGEGTTFTIKIPLEQECEDAA